MSLLSASGSRFQVPPRPSDTQAAVKSKSVAGTTEPPGLVVVSVKTVIAAERFREGHEVVEGRRSTELDDAGSKSDALIVERGYVRIVRNI